MSDLAGQLAQAGIPAFKCPPGTRLHILNLGTLQADEGWLLQGAGTATGSVPNPEKRCRKLMSISALINHPHAGLLLYETGCAEDLEVKWGAPLTDVFPRTSYTEDNKLPNAIKAAGYDIKDVKGIIMGHLHLDHAGGLEHFMGTDIPIYVHEEEFKHAVWACATKADAGVYLENYLNLSQLNWTTFTDTMLDLFQGLTLHLTPGHTPGLCVMQLNLETDGTFIFTSDQFHVKENHTLRQPQGWLARQHTEWFRSLNNIERLRRLFNATLVYGHDYEVADELIQKQAYFS